MSQGIKMSRDIATSYISAIYAGSAADVTPCGSYRRGAPAIGDLDIAVHTPNFEETATQIITGLNATVQRGGSKMKVLITPNGHQIDLYHTLPEFMGAMLLFLTGSARHNMKMRAKAKHRGLRLNQYGLWDEDGECLASTDERDIYEALEMTYVTPDRR
jgi:DNA polymerase (family 10)